MLRDNSATKTKSGGNVDLSSEIEKTVTLIPFRATNRAGVRPTQLLNCLHNWFLEIMFSDRETNVLQYLYLFTRHINRRSEGSDQEHLGFEEDDVRVVVGASAMVRSAR
jgi:hypothetical protein